MEYFKNLPEELTFYILTRVPTESVFECKSVCKTWNNLVSHHPSFKKIHLYHLNHPFSDSGKSGFLALIRNAHGRNAHGVAHGLFDFCSQSPQLCYFEYNENLESATEPPIQRIRKMNVILPSRYTDIIGSCNGLICFVVEFPSLSLRIPPEADTYICNPITKEYLMLPKIKRDIYWSIGFGYISSTNEYKVVGAYKLKNTQFVQVHIYTLGSGEGWRNLGRYDFGDEKWGEGVFSNGVLYWLDIKSDMIVTFDLAEEKFGERLSPPAFPSDSMMQELQYSSLFNMIGVMNGKLFFAVKLVVEGAICYDIWLSEMKNDSHAMKDQRDERKSLGWTKEFRIGKRELFAMTKTGNVLTYTSNSLNIYDPKASTSKRLVNFEEQICRVFPHTNTLVSLKELGEEDTKVMESFEVEKTEINGSH